MDSLGDRMKEYERDFRTRLPKRQTQILRADGKAFHTYTRGCEKPFDFKLIDAMDQCAIALCKEIQGAQLAFVQSDEISVLIQYHKKFDSQAWFDRQVQKMVSVAAAIASSEMTVQSANVFGEIRRAAFDARVFILPEAEVANYFLWRQNDWTRNSVQMLARSLYSQKKMMNKNNTELQEMIWQKGQNWNDLPTYLKRGRCILKEVYLPKVADSFDSVGAYRTRWVIDSEIPIFSQDREYIEKLLALEEE